MPINNAAWKLGDRIGDRTVEVTWNVSYTSQMHNHTNTLYIEVQCSTDDKFVSASACNHSPVPLDAELTNISMITDTGPFYLKLQIVRNYNGIALPEMSHQLERFCLSKSLSSCKR